MSKFIAVEGMTLEIDPISILGTISIIGDPSEKIKQDNKKVYLDNLEIQVTNITSPGDGATIPDTGPITSNIISTSEKSKDNGTLLLLNGDETGEISATPQIPGTPPTPFPVTFKIKISDPGQNKSKTD